MRATALSLSAPGPSSLGAPRTGAPLDTGIGGEDAADIPAEKAGQARRSPGQTITGVPLAAADRVSRREISTRSILATI